MDKRTWALLLSAYIIVLIVTAPSAIISPVLDYTCGGRIALANTQGTIWQGTANPVLHQRNGGLITLSAVHWSIAPLALLTGKLSAQLNWDNAQQTVPMNIIVSAGQIELQHTYIPLPAILLDEASDFLKPAVLRGQIILKSEALLITQQGVQGSAIADWLNASSLLSSIAPLGNYHFIFSSSPAGVEITLSTTSGALLLAGQGRFLFSTGLDFQGTAQAASGKEEALHELLSHLGPQEHPGINSFRLVPGRTH
jgi:general secretion pathway protein N